MPEELGSVGLIRKTPAEVRKALDPFGYYTPTVDVRCCRHTQGAPR
ncbi:MAG: hypothetical protein IPO08_17015 [Xanthomonadales bacterium]|nr:hypothetical protein [Xanthomonadales bacterium]